MMGDEAFEALIQEIERLGYDRETAERYAEIIGDIPVRGQDGKIVVIDDDGRELARLALRFF